MRGAIARATLTGELPAPVRGAIAYMLSAEQWIGEDVGRWRPHVMVYLPFATHADIGIHPLDTGFPQVSEGPGTPFATLAIPAPDRVEVVDRR